MGIGIRWKWAAILGLAVWGVQAQILFEERFEKGLTKQWERIEFTGETKHTIVSEGTNSYLRAEAASSASGLGVKLNDLEAKGAVLTWKWRIDKVPEGGSEDVKKTFDHTARLFVAFDTFIGPPRTINYVWANQTPVGKTFHHPSSGRGRFIVLQNGNAKAGEWITEKRNIFEDWKLLFGNDDPPEIVSIGFMTDSDGTKTTVTGGYDDIVLERR